jgi:anti-sigma regulatory factor (Ser/Thr protein kinase)
MTADHDRSAFLRLAPEAHAPGKARDFLARTCVQWDVPQFLEAGAIVVSELVTNAVRHAGTQVLLLLALGRRDAVLTVTVRDRGGGVPHVVPADQRRIGGRGLAMVAALSESWGVDAVRDGKSVWCRLEAAPRPPRAPETPGAPAPCRTDETG